MNLFVFFLLALKASLLSTGGLGNVPSLRDDMLVRNWATERHFAEAIAVGQVSPGPNGLWVVSFGYLTGGVPGALLATLAIVIPPLLILYVDKLYRRVQHHPAVDGLVRGLSLATTGLFVVSMYGLLQGNGLNIKSLLIAAVSCGLGATKRVPIAVIIALAAVVGIIFR